jgi:ADP-heptose:LPS heptosyltransferase/GT2 family glycosyltransferase
MRRLGEYDLVLRATEAAHRIQRIPRVLCERAAVLLDAPEREREALGCAALRRGLDAEVVDGCAQGYYRLRLKHRSSSLVSVIVPTGGKVDLLTTCVTGLFERTAYRNFELVILYNTMTRPEVFPYLDRLANDPRVKIIDSQGPFNFSRICNLGAANAAGEFLLFLNDDIETIDPGWLDAMIAQAERPEVGLVGARLLYPDGKIQHAGIFWAGSGGRHAFRFAAQDDAGYFGLAVTARNCIAVTGACILTRRGWFYEIGGFDEEHAIINNDVDLCLRSWEHGGAVVYEPAVTLIHHESVSRVGLPDEFDLEGFDRRWGSILGAGDPYYHPSLARDCDDFSPDDEPVQVIYAGHPLFRRDEIRRILVSKLDHLGDFVAAMPAIARLREHLPKAEIYLLVLPGSASLTTFIPGIKEVIPFEFFFARSALGPRKLTADDMEELRRRLLPYRFDLAIDLRKSLDTRTVLRFTGARWFVGFDRNGRFPWLDIALEWEGDEPRIAKRSHIGDDLCRLADAVALATVPERMVFSPPPAAAAPAPTPPRKRVVYIHPGAGSEMKLWPSREFARLIGLLIAHHDVAVKLLGSPDEAPIVDEILFNLTHRDGVESLVGETGLADLPELLRSAALFVGNDSGPKHIAAGVGVPTIGIHSGVVDGREWGPMGPSAVAVRRDMRCGPCYLPGVDACSRSLACLTELRAERVYEVAQRMLLIG